MYQFVFFLISKLFRSLQALRYLITSVFTYYSSYLSSQWSFAPGPFSQKSLQKLGSMFQVYVIIQKNGKESVKKKLTPVLTHLTFDLEVVFSEHTTVNKIQPVQGVC